MGNNITQPQLKYIRDIERRNGVVFSGCTKEQAGEFIDRWYRLESTNRGKRAYTDIKTPKRVMFSGRATILFWEDDSKTIVKTSKTDKFDKRVGFLMAYFEKMSGMSRTKANKYLDKILTEEEENANM